MIFRNSFIRLRDLQKDKLEVHPWVFLFCLLTYSAERCPAPISEQPFKKQDTLCHHSGVKMYLGVQKCVVPQPGENFTKVLVLGIPTASWLTFSKIFVVFGFIHNIDFSQVNVLLNELSLSLSFQAQLILVTMYFFQLFLSRIFK